MDTLKYAHIIRPSLASQGQELLRALLVCCQWRRSWCPSATHKRNPTAISSTITCTRRIKGWLDLVLGDLSNRVYTALHIYFNSYSPIKSIFKIVSDENIVILINKTNVYTVLVVNLLCSKSTLCKLSNDIFKTFIAFLV